MRIAPFLSLLSLFVVGSACHDSAPAPCANGTCICAAGDHCDLPCAAPPCHIACDEGSTCTGTCANAECICAKGASCTFECGAPPCHVDCRGSNSQCDGTCANGSCTCGPGSTCHFRCQSSPCHTACAEGAKCIVECPEGLGGSSCDITECHDGTAQVCPGGSAVACGLPCPAG